LVLHRLHTPYSPPPPGLSRANKIAGTPRSTALHCTALHAAFYSTALHCFRRCAFQMKVGLNQLPTVLLGAQIQFLH
jgi:hypothetical protein